MITLQEHKQAVTEVKKLNKIKKTENTKFSKEERNINDRYYKLENNLRNKKRQETDRVYKKEKKFNEKIKKQIEPHSEKLNEFKEIIDLIDTQKKQVNLDIELSIYDYPKDDKGMVIRTDEGRYPEREHICIEPISILQDNKFYKIAVYIYKNTKPINKFTLCAVGRSIFDSKKILNFGWSYLSDAGENGHFKKVLKELPDKKDLIKWFEKNTNRNNIFKKEINKIEETIKKYEEVIKNTDSDEWKIAYLENRKNYYEKSVSRGTGTKEYSDIIQELIELTKGKEKTKYVQILKKIVIENLN